MKIIYKNKKTEKLCEDTKKAIKVLGKDIAISLANLINAIEEFNCLYDISLFPQYRLHQLSNNRQYQYSLTIQRSSKWRLIIYPLDEDENIWKSYENEKIKLTKAVCIEVLEVSKHYE